MQSHFYDNAVSEICELLGEKSHNAPRRVLNNSKSVSVDFSSKQKYRQLKLLKEEENVLKKNLKQVEQNEKLLQDEGFLSLNNSIKGYAVGSKFDKAMKEQQIKAIQSKKRNIIEKIKDLEIRIIHSIEDDNKLTSQEKRKLFIINFERDKEIAEIRAKKYLKESKERKQRMKNDINQLIEKRKKEIEQKDKEEQKHKEEAIKKFKEKERAIEQMHAKKNIGIMEKYKPFREKKLEKKEKDYRYMQIYEKFKKKQENMFNKVKEKRHQLIESANIADINEFTKQLDLQKEELKLAKAQFVATLRKEGLL